MPPLQRRNIREAWQTEHGAAVRHQNRTRIQPRQSWQAVSIRGNAIVGATLYADDAGITNNTGTLSYQWMADEREISGANSAF